MAQPNIVQKWQSWAPEFRSLLRIVAALLFIQFGTMKLFGYPISMPPNMPPLRLLSEVGIAGILETFGGGLMLIGLFTRPVAFILSGEMAVAYFQGHAPNGFWTLANGGSDAVLFCFLWLYFSAAGAGPWSLDAKRNKQITE
jgi:putative oxidoreductase